MPAVYLVINWVDDLADYYQVWQYLMEKKKICMNLDILFIFSITSYRT